MPLSLTQITPAAGFVGFSVSSRATSFVGGGASVAGTIASQFVKQQASLIFNRHSASDRVFIHQGIQNRAQTLERAARALFSRNDGESVFGQRQVVGSSSGAVSGTADRLTSPFTFGIDVSNLATAQEVVSDILSDAGDNFTDGTQAFSLTVSGTTFSMSVDVSASDTNLDVLNAIAAEVNAADSSGVYAEVVSDGATGESSLALTSLVTGTDSAFTLSGSILSGVNLEETTAVDTNAGTGGLRVTAQDATYSLNAGVSLTSQSNTLSLYGGSVELVLSATTAGEAVTVRVQPDTREITAELENFVGAYNDALSFALALPSEATTTFALELRGAVAPFVSSLQSIGVDRTSDGTLSIDPGRLAGSLRDGRFARASASFVGPAGLATVSERASRNLLDSGSEFLTHPKDRVEGSALLAISRLQNLGMIVDLIA